MPSQDKDEVGLLRVVAGDYDRLLGFAVACFRIQLQSNGSLAAGRDCPVILGNRAASAGDHLFDIQDRFARVSNAEFMDKFFFFAEGSEVMGGLKDFDHRGQVAAERDKLVLIFGQMCGWIEEADLGRFGLHRKGFDTMAGKQFLSATGAKKTNEYTSRRGNQPVHIFSPP